MPDGSRHPVRSGYHIRPGADRHVRPMHPMLSGDVLDRHARPELHPMPSDDVPGSSGGHFLYAL